MKPLSNRIAWSPQWRQISPAFAESCDVVGTMAPVIALNSKQP